MFRKDFEEGSEVGNVVVVEEEDEDAWIPY